MREISTAAVCSLLMASAAIAALPAGANPAIRVANGPVLFDLHRGKSLSVRVTYPGFEGRFPVLIFSHGAGGTPEDYDTLVFDWVARGYVCIQPFHDDSRRLGDEAARGSLMYTLTDHEGWENRARDISFIIDSLETIGTSVAGLEDAMDAGRIGVAGHSYGAHTAQLMAGALVSFPDPPIRRSYGDDRVAAFLLLSPQGEGQQGLTRASWRPIKRPMMSVTGSRDRVAHGRKPGWRMAPYRYSQPGDKYHIYIEDLHHYSFSDPPDDDGQSPADVEALRLIGKSTGAFWDAYLKGQTQSLVFLRSDELHRASSNRVRIHRR